MKRKILIISMLISMLGILVFVVQNNQQNPKNQEISQAAKSNKKAIKKSNEIISEKYYIKRENKRLYGVITAPRGYKKEKLPLIVLSHGFNNTLEMYNEYANRLARLGYIVYRFDFYGGSTNSKSGGQDMLSMSVLTEKRDLAAVVSNFSKKSYIDKKAITLVGASQGGVVSTLYAADNPKKIKNLVLLFPAFVLFDDVKETYANLGVSSTNKIPKIITHQNARLGAIYLRDALKVNINKEIKKVKVPVLIIQGTDDEVVPYRYAINANKTFPNSKLVKVDGGVHWLDSRFNRVAFPAIERFLTK